MKEYFVILIGLFIPEVLTNAVSGRKCLLDAALSCPCSLSCLIWYEADIKTEIEDLETVYTVYVFCITREKQRVKRGINGHSSPRLFVPDCSTVL